MVLLFLWLDLVLQDWADQGFICCFFGFFSRICWFLMRKPSVLFALLVRVSDYVECPIKVVLFVYDKVFC